VAESIAVRDPQHLDRLGRPKDPMYGMIFGARTTRNWQKGCLCRDGTRGGDVLRIRIDQLRRASSEGG
jgi:hypothetical protein